MGDDDDLIARCCAATEPQVQRARPDQYVTVTEPGPPTTTFTPDAEVYQAAVMLAARLVRRRNSPAGIESFGESILYVSKWDNDIARALRAGMYALPAVG